MVIADLELKVTKASEKVEKCKKTIERHEKQLAKKIKDGAPEYDIKWKNEDIKGATKKLNEAERILGNWQQKLSEEKEKERFLEGNAPQVVKDFLEEWKTKAYEWYIRRFEAYKQFKKDLEDQVYEAQVECVKLTPEYSRYLDENGEIDKYYQRNLLNVFPRKPMETYLKERYLDWRSVENKKVNFAGKVILHMETIYDVEERLMWLDKTLEQEKKAKMLDLITRINKVIGVITDASQLSISEIGNLNGIIEGENGKAKVETIGAGGWNIQCFHFRTLVNKL